MLTLRRYNMADAMEKCPHCFGLKPVKAKVCLHCGRDAEGFGPMIRSSKNGVTIASRQSDSSDGLDLRLHMLAAAVIAAIGFLIMISTGFGVVLFTFGLGWLFLTKARLWWRKHERQFFR